jgi:hypothetical protein
MINAETTNIGGTRAEMDENPVATKTNPLGVKGAGEARNVGALARRRPYRHAGHTRKSLAYDPRGAGTLTGLAGPSGFQPRPAAGEAVRTGRTNLGWSRPTYPL